MVLVYLKRLKSSYSLNYMYRDEEIIVQHISRMLRMEEPKDSTYTEDMNHSHLKTLLGEDAK